MGSQVGTKTVQQPRPDLAGLGKGRVGTVGVTRRGVNSSASPTKLKGAGNLAKVRLKKLWSQGGIKVDQLIPTRVRRY